jgi:dTDP-4-amino-4,6-dideoxy-D-glucose acyltransferase
MSEFKIEGLELMGENVKSRLKKCGDNVKIFPMAKLAFPHVIELGDHCKIRDFVFIFAGIGVTIGEYTDMQPHVTIWGGGETIIGNRVSVGPGTVLLSAVYSHADGMKMVDGMQDGESNALYGRLKICDDVYIGANCSLMPNIIIGQGAVIGAGSFVNKDVDPWTIVAGSPAKKIGERKPLGE